MTRNRIYPGDYRRRVKRDLDSLDYVLESAIIDCCKHEELEDKMLGACFMSGAGGLFFSVVILTNGFYFIGGIFAFLSLVVVVATLWCGVIAEGYASRIKALLSVRDDLNWCRHVADQLPDPSQLKRGRR